MAQQFYQTASFAVPAAGNTTVLTIPLGATQERLFVQFDVAAFALDAFRILARSHPSATATLLYSLAADYAAPTGILVGASGDLTTVAAAGSGWFILDVRGLYEVTVQASANGGTALVTMYAGAQ